jgi:predicted dehydrogenase
MQRDFRELLARTDIDAVMISTPDHWHVPMALAAVRAGKDVSCEKPLTLCVREGRVLADAVKQHGRVFRTDSEFRSSKAAYRLVELVRTGRIGTLRRIITGVPGTDVAKPMPPPMPVPGDLDFDAWLGPAPERPYHVDRVHPARNLTGRPGWMRCRDYAQGLISNWGTHLNDIAQWGNNTDHIGPVEVEATGEFPPESGLWNVLLKFRARFRYANGVTLECRTGRPSVRFEGDDGWLEVEYGKGRIEASKPALLEGNPTASAGLLPRRGDKEDFIRAIQSRGRTMEDAEVGHRTCSLSQIALISIQVGGRKLAWDPARERFDHEPANALLDRPSWRGPWRV